MFLIRTVEVGISERYSSGKMRCPTHLSVGQEATPSVLSAFLRHSDYAVSTHRSHAHYLAKGGNLDAMLSEIYGLDDGCSKGRGGSMHLADRSVRFMGSSAIVGNSIPVGVGLGMAAKLDAGDNLSVVYLGDGAVEEGVFYESINFAVVAELPVLFVCENNGYSVYSDFSVRQPIQREIHKMVAGLGIESSRVSSFEVETLSSTLRNSVDRVRESRKPVFIEVLTSRHLEHCGPGDDSELGYRDVHQLQAEIRNDPLLSVANLLSKMSVDVFQIDSEVRDFVESAFSRVEQHVKVMRLSSKGSL